MARINEKPTSQIHIQIHPEQQQDDHIKADGPTVSPKSMAENLSSKVFLLIFYLHLILLPILMIFLAVRGMITCTRTYRMSLLLHWYSPLFTSSALAALIAIACQVVIRRKPPTTLRTIFWLSPMLTCAVGILFLAIGTAGGFGAATFAIAFALIQSLYGCWVVPRMDHATQILSVSLSAPISKATTFLTMSLLVATIYSSLVVSGLGGLTKTQTRLDPLLIFVILLSLAWTMHVIRNTLHAAVARPAYLHFTSSIDADARVAFGDIVNHSLGNVCLGSILVPIVGAFRCLARVMSSIAGDTDEFMFSCASCYASLADRLVVYGNRWGFVHVGVYSKGFVSASVETWEMFERGGMKPLIDSDLTGTFCFLCGIAGGSFCALVGGSWALAVEKDFATQVSIYAFLIGYFMIRIAVSWPQACVSAYHVAFVENPRSLQFDSTIIPSRIQELQKSQA